MLSKLEIGGGSEHKLCEGILTCSTADYVVSWLVIEEDPDVREALVQDAIIDMDNASFDDEADCDNDTEIERAEDVDEDEPAAVRDLPGVVGASFPVSSAEKFGVRLQFTGSGFPVGPFSLEVTDAVHKENPRRSRQLRITEMMNPSRTSNNANSN